MYDSDCVYNVHNISGLWQGNSSPLHRVSLPLPPARCPLFSLVPVSAYPYCPTSTYPYPLSQNQHLGTKQDKMTDVVQAKTTIGATNVQLDIVREIVSDHNVCFYALAGAQAL